jgi:hypothetical protein
MAKERQEFMIDRDLLERMMAVKARTGLSRSEQVRRGIQMWLESREWPVHASDPRRSRLSHRLPPFAGLPPVSDGEY